MWTTEKRPRYNRDQLRYPSDLTDEEWGHLEHLIPPAKRGGRRREIDEREVVNGLLYVLSTGCQWRYIPRDLPPRSTLFDYFQRWGYDGTLLRIHYELYQKCRELVDRQASPTACVIDSQSVKSAEKGGAHIDPSGYDAGKKIKGKKRHILVDTMAVIQQHKAKVDAQRPRVHPAAAPHLATNAAPDQTWNPELWASAMINAMQPPAGPVQPSP